MNQTIYKAKLAALDALASCQNFTLNNVEDYHLALVGSTFIQGTTPLGSDIDLLLTVPVSPEELHLPGWAYGGSTPLSGDAWCSWKKLVNIDGAEVTVNLLICSSKEYIDSWLTAAEVCKFLHLKGVHLDRGCVHGVHEVIMDGAVAEDEILKRNYK